jgi:hypothetical protein
LHIGDNIYVRKLWSLVLHGLEIFAPRPMLLEVEQVHEVRVESCHLSGAPERRPLLRISDATNVYVGNSTFEALFDVSVLAEAVELFSFFPPLSELFLRGEWRDFSDAMRWVAMDLAGLPPPERQGFWRQILSLLNGAHLNPLSMGEENAYRRFAYALAQEDISPFSLVDHLIAIREEAIRAIAIREDAIGAQVAIALEIGWGEPAPARL